MNNKLALVLRRPFLLRIVRYLALAALSFVAVNHSTRLLGLVLFATTALAALPLWRFRRGIALTGFVLLGAAELLPFDITFLHAPGPPRLVPYLEGMREGLRVALGFDGRFHYLDYPDAVCVFIPLFPNPPRFVVVW